MAAEERLLTHIQESVKDSVQCELVCRENGRRVDKMAEKEREHQVRLLMAMKDDAMVSGLILYCCTVNHVSKPTKLLSN